MKTGFRAFSSRVVENKPRAQTKRSALAPRGASGGEKPVVERRPTAHNDVVSEKHFTRSSRSATSAENPSDFFSFH